MAIYNNKLYDFLKSKNITESSLKLYFNNLRRLNGGEFPKTFTFLKNVDGILEKLNQYKPNTRRSYLVSIITVLKHEPKMKKLYDKYYVHLDGYNKSLSKNNEKSETQKANWITQDEVKETYEKMSEEVKPLLEQKKLSPSEYEKLIRWVVLSLYVLQKPRRNADYQKCVIVNSLKKDSALGDSVNYLVLGDSKWIFTNYKTKGTYKNQEVDISPEMMGVIRSYIKFHPLGKELKKKSGVVPFLTDFEGRTFDSVNAITRMLNKVFGKKIGVSMLRNIYLTDKYGDQLKELQETSKEMGTSASTIQNTYVKTDEAIPSTD